MATTNILYPDNKNRDSRVTQLTGDITSLQSQIKRSLEDSEKHDEKTLKDLDEIAKKQGFKTRDEYLKNAEKNLSEDDKKVYDDMKKQFEKDSRMDIVIASGLGVVAMGVAFTKNAAAISTIFKGSLLRITLQAIGLGLYRTITGQPA
ncbi:hypothetical protein AMATHDRAFT_49045 [Amanita thiersii Skay4041]|uniref:Uncharacterized protein n=1 Tax=Amanita thiersii Skay4041 TaxID=703135 RepID=A0A2A9NL74_9AGAR|nr:hypothetical protein AMATHDRAFT_49045 [Amanita thiersii Skay4041]